MCALVVALEHFNVASPLHRNEFVHHGYRFVDFFFVLSGFVISHAYGERLRTTSKEISRFLVRRIGRLWPLHLVVLGAFIVFQLASIAAVHLHLLANTGSFAARNTLESLPANLFLVHSWGFMGYASWNNPSWSISTEVFAYALFAVLCTFIPRRWFYAVALWLAVGAASVIFFKLPAGMQATYDYGMLRCIYGFMIGVVVRYLWGKWPAATGTAGEVLGIAAVVVAVTFLPLGPPAIAITPVFGVVVWIFASESGAVSALLRGNIPQALGRWSYSIYMVHAFIVICLLTVAMLLSKHGIPCFTREHGVTTIVGPWWATTAVIISYLSVILVTARWTYRHVEVPGQRLFRRLEKAE